MDQPGWMECSRCGGKWHIDANLCPACGPSDNPERDDIIRRFTQELLKATGDGQKKRAAGTKPPWYIDPSHEAAVYRHLERWEDGERVDKDSGAHPLVHAAWRMLAIACKETGNAPNH